MEALWWKLPITAKPFGVCAAASQATYLMAHDYNNWYQGTLI
jgi:hypothetical protein